MLFVAGVVASSNAAHASRWDALHLELEGIQQRQRVPALLLVIVDGETAPLIRASELPGAPPVTAAMPFRWGSISKAVTALVALEAARGADVPLDVPVAPLLEMLPYRNPWHERHPLRLDQLLELAAGLPDLSRAEFSDNTPLPLQLALARHARTRVMLWPPGLQHSYSNVPPGITAAVVERLTGLTFEEAARQLVFEPLGMAPASYEPVPDLPGGFRADGTSPIAYWHMTFPAFGALNASPAAMARLIEALLTGGRVAGRQAVAAPSVARMYRPVASAGARAGLEIGYGAGLYGWVTDGFLFHGHGGDADGYQSRLGLLPDAGRGYLIGINVDDPRLLQRLRRRVEQALVADLVPPQPPPAAQVELQRYTGDYYPASVRFGIGRWQAGQARPARVTLVEGALTVRRGSDVQPLIALGAGRFRRPGDPAASVVFVDWQGTLLLQGELGNYARTSVPPCAEFVPICSPPH